MVFAHSLPLVPLPVSAVPRDGQMPLTAKSRVHGAEVAGEQLIAAVDERTGIRLSRGTDAVNTGDIVLRIGSEVAAPEGYILDVGQSVEITGADQAGLFYGLQTFLQLLREDGTGWSIQRSEITDAPRFGYRGVMLDVARHFFGVADVKAFIDRASSLKFNHLHLHLTDDQGWRIHIDSWPRLTELSSSSSVDGHPGGFYTKPDYREIVAHAALRHMVIVPEIDLPGHTHAVGVAYPELVEAPVMNDALISSSASLGQPLPVAGETYQGWGVGHSSVRIREERTYEFVRDVVHELAELTPGPYLHIGGDESLGTSQEDFDYFVARATEIVVAAGKTPIAWHEAGSAASIAEGTVGQYWSMTEPTEVAAEEATQFVARGGKLILSPANTAYLDMKYTADFPLGLTWAAIVDVKTSYEWEPTAIVDVADSAILGVEAPLWSETTATLADVDQLVFPRAAAHAEVAWSVQDAPERVWASFRERVGSLAPLWNSAGINFYQAPEIDWSDR